MAVLLVGTLDTKAAEVRFVRDRLAAAGLAVRVADAGSVGPPGFAADFPREQVFGGVPPTDRGEAVAKAAAGVEKLAAELHKRGTLSGVFGLGGSAGTTIAAAACRVVPVGVPKVIVSTLASGDVRPYVGTRDVLMLYSVVDLAGLNRVSRRVLANAADAMAGMLKGSPLPADADKPLVAATMFGVTTPCVTAAAVQVAASGYEVLTFHATGAGGRTMEGLIRDRLIAGVLDITTTELADELCGGVMSAGRDRLTAAGLVGVPQVISVGALDMVNFGPPDTVPERYRGRQFYHHNPTVTLMRTTPEENDRLGKEIAEKACAATGPTVIVLPRRGVSALDIEGGPFWRPDADAALFDSIRQWVYGVPVIDLDLHVNDPAFAAACAAKLLELMRADGRSPVTSSPR